MRRRANPRSAQQAFVLRSAPEKTRVRHSARSARGENQKNHNLGLTNARRAYIIYQARCAAKTIWSSIEVVITSTIGNRVTVKSRPRVQIPPTPPLVGASDRTLAPTYFIALTPPLLFKPQMLAPVCGLGNGIRERAYPNRSRLTFAGAKLSLLRRSFLSAVCAGLCGASCPPHRKFRWAFYPPAARHRFAEALLLMIFCFLKAGGRREIKTATGNIKI